MASLTLEVPPVVTMRADTVHGVLTVLGPIADDHGIEEAIGALVIAMAFIEHQQGFLPRETSQALTRARKLLARAVRRLGSGAEVTELVMEMQIE